MEEVKKSDVEIIVNEFENYLRHLITTHFIDLNVLKNFVEPQFKKFGYRTTPKIGEKLNVLIIHDAAIGDFVLLSGAVREFRRLYPGAYITLIVNSGSLNLAEHCPHVDEVIYNEQNYNPTDFNGLYHWNLYVAKRLLTRHHHICYAFIHRPNTALLTYMSGAQFRFAHPSDEIMKTFVLNYDGKFQENVFNSNVLFKMSLDILTTNILSMFTFGGHIVDTHLSFVDHALKVPTENRELEIWYTSLELHNAKNFLVNATKPIYALGMGGREQRKHYPPERYAKLAEKILIEEPTATFIILGGGEDDLKSAQIFKENLNEKIFSEHVIDLTNKTPYRVSAAILTLCNMYIGNDTGIMHVAAAAKCPVLCVNCFPTDLPPNRADYVRFFSPYHVPSVTIQPAHALPECAVNDPYNPYGCRIGVAHCINQIELEKVFRGYQILLGRIAEKNIEPYYMN